MEKSISFVLFFVVVNACLLSAFGALAQEEHKEDGKLWNEIWKNIQKDNEKMGDQEDKTTGNADQLSQLLQKRLDAAASSDSSNIAESSSTITTAATSGVDSDSNTDIDMKMLLSFVKKSGVTLSNEQWMSLLQHVLDAKMARSQSSSTTTTTPTTTTTMNPTTTTATTTPPSTTTISNSVDKNNWLNDLQKALDVNQDISQQKKEKIMALLKTARPAVTTDSTATTNPKHGQVDEKIVVSEEEFDRLMQKMQSEIDATNNDKPLDVTQDVSQKQKEKIMALLKTTRPAVTTDSTTTTKSEHGRVDKKIVVSEKEWDHLMQKMQTEIDAMNNEKEHTTSSTTSPRPTSVPKPTHAEKKKIFITNEQWDAFLEQAFVNGGDGKLDGIDLNLKPTESSEKSTTKGGVFNRVFTSNNGVISNQEWDQVLEQMEDEVSKQQKSGGVVSDGTAHLATKSSETQTKKATTFARNLVTDTEWEHVLQDALDMNQNSANQATSTPQTKRPHEDKLVPVDEVLDTEWENILQTALYVNQEMRESTSNKKTAQSTTPALKTTSGSGTNWEHNVQDILDADGNVKDSNFVKKTPKSTTPQTPNTHKAGALFDADVSDSEWEHILQEAFDGDRAVKDSSFVSKPTHKTASTKPTTSNSQNVQQEHDAELEWEEHELEWEDRLQAALDTAPSKSSPQLLKRTPTTTTTTTTTSTSTPKTSTGNTVVSAASDNVEVTLTADEKWEKLMNKKMSGDGMKTTSDIKSSVSEETSQATERDTVSQSHTSQEVFSNMKSIVKDVSETKDFYLVLGFGIGSGVLLVVLVVAVVLTVCRMKRMMCWAKKDMHTTVLNADGNRWNPQALRPSKENMNAFLYSIPTPMKEIRIDY